MAYDHAFSTRSLPPQQRVARWTEEAADRFVRLDFRVRNPDGFIASMLNRDVSDLALTRILSAGHGCKRITPLARPGRRGVRGVLPGQRAAGRRLHDPAGRARGAAGAGPGRDL